MSASYNQPILFGTRAERLAWIPAHPGSAPAGEDAPGGLRWQETDTGEEYIWDWTNAAWRWTTAVGSSNYLAFMYNVASSDIAGYMEFLPTHSADPKDTLSYAGLAGGNNLLEEWATEPAAPGTDFLPDGIWHWHVHAAKTAGTKTARLYFEAYKRTDPGGVETLLGTSEQSNPLTGAETEYDIETALADFDVDTTDRIVLKAYAAVSGAGAAPTVALYVEGDTAARLEFPTLAGAAAAGAPANAQYLTLALNGSLSAERVLTAGEGIDFTDTGADGTLTIDGEDASAINKGIASFSADHFSVAAGAVSLAADGIDDTLIDWGTAAGQVSGVDVPIADAGNYFTTDNVEAALQEVGGVDPASHKHSKIVASDGSPDPALSADAAGALTAVNGLTLSDGDLTIAAGGTVKIDASVLHAIHSLYLGMPGLRGFWPMSAVGSAAGSAIDMSEAVLHLSVSGNPKYKVANNLVPYLDFDGTGDYLAIATTTGVEITASESWFATPGFFMTCWVKFDSGTPGASEIIMSKWGAAGQRSYNLFHGTDGTITAQVSVDGTAATNQATTGTTSTGWVFVAMRLTPSTSLDVWLGVGGALEKATNTTSIPASIFNSTTAFNISGRASGTSLMAGDVTLAALASFPVGDAYVTALYQQGRALFGV